MLSGTVKRTSSNCVKYVPKRCLLTIRGLPLWERDGRVWQRLTPQTGRPCHHVVRTLAWVSKFNTGPGIIPSLWPLTLGFVKADKLSTHPILETRLIPQKYWTWISMWTTGQGSSWFLTVSNTSVQFHTHMRRHWEPLGLFQTETASDWVGSISFRELFSKEPGLPTGWGSYLEKKLTC